MTVITCKLFNDSLSCCVVDGAICLPAKTTNDMTCPTGVISVTSAYWARYRQDPGCDANQCPCHLSYMDCVNQADSSVLQPIQLRCDGRKQCFVSIDTSGVPSISPRSLCSGVDVGQSTEPQLLRVAYHCLHGEYHTKFCKATFPCMNIHFFPTM